MPWERVDCQSRFAGQLVGRASNVWVTFRPKNNKDHLFPGHPHAGSLFWLHAETPTCDFIFILISHYLEKICTKIPVWVDSRWGNCCTTATPPSQVREPNPVAWWDILPGYFHSCNECSDLLPCCDMHYALHSALLGSPSWLLNPLFISSAQPAKYIIFMMGWANP